MKLISRGLVLLFITLVLFTGGTAVAQQPVATINNISVYSDKNVTGIVNTKITFSDKSWCDVATGEVVNRGPGYINIGTSGINEETISVGPKVFNAKALDIRNVVANVTIMPTDAKQMTVLIKGPKSLVETIGMKTADGTLVIESGNHGKTRSSSTTITGNNSISINSGSVVSSGNSIVINSGGNSRGSKSDTSVIISVPKGSSLIMAGIQGNVEIGDVEGPINASVLGSYDIKAGNMLDSRLSVQGSGKITIASVRGDLSMNIQGSGDIRVRNGLVSMLSVNIQGSGDARFDGEATDAYLAIMGSGDIDVNHVTNQPTQNVTGHGDITIDNW